MLKLLYFASLVDRLGRASESIDLPEAVTTIRGVVDLLKARGGVWEEVFGRDSVRITVNKQFGDLNTPVNTGDEVAFISAS